MAPNPMKEITTTATSTEEKSNAELREDWVEVKVQEIAELYRGITYKKDQATNSEGQGLVPLLRANNIDRNINLDNLVYVPKALVKNHQIIMTDDILFAMSSGSKHLVGKSAQATSDLHCSYGAFCALLRPSKLLTGRYVGFFFQSSRFRKRISEIAKGTNINNLKRDHILATTFPLAPLPEQRAIVEKVEALFGEINRGVAELQKAQKQLITYRQAVLKKAFEGELTREWRESNTQRNDTQQSQEDIPLGWTHTTTGEVMELISNGYTPKSEFLMQGSGEIPFIKVYNLCFNGSLDFTINPTFIPEEKHCKELKRSICKPGDVLINIVGPPLGKVSIVPETYPEWNINQAIVRFRPNDQVGSNYLSYLLQNPIIIRWLENTSRATAGQFNIKVTTCRKIPFLLPPLAEQQQIVEEIETRLSLCDAVEASLTAGLAKAAALKQSVLKEAFAGRLLNNTELAACRAAPDWAPAAELLAAIQTSKQKK